MFRRSVVPRKRFNWKPRLPPLRDPILHRPQVVLVEDDAAVLNALTFAFEIHGYPVQAFGSAEALLAALPEGEGICLVVDEKLPGLSGLDLVARLRERGHGSPAILITTNPTEQTRRRAAVAGVEIVEKPLLGDRLLNVVRSVFARGGVEAS